MQVNALSSVDQLHLALSDFFGCPPARLGDRLIWTPAKNRVITMAILHEPQNGLLELEVTLGCASATTTIEVHALWARLAAISEQSGKAAVPIIPDKGGDNRYRIAARRILLPVIKHGLLRRGDGKHVRQPQQHEQQVC